MRCNSGYKDEGIAVNIISHFSFQDKANFENQSARNFFHLRKERANRSVEGVVSSRLKDIYAKSAVSVESSLGLHTSR